MDDYQIEKLRQKLLDYAGTAMFSGFPAAFLDVVDIDSADEKKLLEFAKMYGIDISDI